MALPQKLTGPWQDRGDLKVRVVCEALKREELSPSVSKGRLVLVGDKHTFVGPHGEQKDYILEEAMRQLEAPGPSGREWDKLDTTEAALGELKQPVWRCRLAREFK